MSSREFVVSLSLIGSKEMIRFLCFVLQGQNYVTFFEWMKFSLRLVDDGWFVPV